METWKKVAIGAAAVVVVGAGTRAAGLSKWWQKFVIPIANTNSDIGYF